MKLRAVLAAALFAGAAYSQVTTVTVYGSVLDPSGSAVNNAKITAANQDTGAAFTAISDTAGEFTLSSLPPGPYTLSIEAPGFKLQRQAGLDFDAGQRVRLSFKLEIGAVTQTVDVNAASPLVNAVNAEQRSNLETQQVEQLPLGRRDWTNLLELDPGVVTTSGGTVSLNGLASSSLRITVDGTDSTSDSEFPSLTMYQNFNFIKGVGTEAVEEVNVAKGIASAEIANTMSGNVNITTKSGTNKFHGSAFELNNTEDTNARNQFLVAKPGLTYNQFGGSFGGPVVQNKLFFFGAYEGYRLRGFQSINGQTPTAEFRALATAAVPAYKPLFDLFPLPNNPTQPGAVTGFYQGSGSERGQDNHADVRVDYLVRDDLTITGRYTRGRPFRAIPRLVSANFRNWSGTTEVGTLNITTAHPSWTAETRVGANWNSVNRLDGQFLTGLAGVDGIGFSTDAENFFKEGSTVSLEEIVGITKGRHSLKFGANYVLTHSGRDDVEVPQVTYANTADFLANLPARVQVTFGVKPFQLSAWTLGGFVQDDFKVNRKLVLNLGLRYDFFSVPREADSRIFNRTGPFGIGPYLPSSQVFKGYYKNISPRLGFAYTVGDSGKTVIRGGAGIFRNPRNLYGGVLDLVQNALDEPFRAIYGRTDILNIGSVLRYPVINSQVLPVAKGPRALISGIAINPDWGYPIAYQWMFSIQRQLSRDLVLESAYVGNHSAGLVMVRIVNQPDRITGQPSYPGYAQFRYRDGSESTHYNGWQNSLTKRFSHGLLGGVAYTWSSTISYTGDADLLLPSAPQDFNNIRADKGPANFDVRHRFSANFVYELPFPARASSHGGAIAAVARGWNIGGIFKAQSGLPVNIVQPSGLDSSRPDLVGGQAVLDNGTGTLQYLNPAAFARVPIGAASGVPIRPGSLGRNPLRSVGLWNLDLSLSKIARIRESAQIQFRADMLNAFNHTNFNLPEARITQSNFGRFTSTLGARVVQFSARFSF